MAKRYPEIAKIVVTFEPRSDGGLRAYSDDVPGFVLSHSDPDAVVNDVAPALEGILSHMFGVPVIVEQLPSLRDHMRGIGDFAPAALVSKEYVSRLAA